MTSRPYLRPLTVGLLAAVSAVACSGASSGNDAFGAQAACEHALQQRVTSGTGNHGVTFADETRSVASGSYRITGSATWRTGLGTDMARSWSCTAVKHGALYRVTVRLG